jgi:hypothetical protein
VQYSNDKESQVSLPQNYKNIMISTSSSPPPVSIFSLDSYVWGHLS